ncbi:MAG: hypothetical protein AVDCRST_MAG01-01-1812 [uncultured Rubrobacteraceae bacterium]|uniref:Uncharacterized protein n=1 Tax=uncultured Rubrobacteraceae bacterium TaxID=349277 RepID=A0A6J4PFE1_9ACTN|nr:MAG: hypothetical protein AVDCRST_MAG01-01-1812 [uncultured Rubrobacteraceae bacterium]
MPPVEREPVFAEKLRCDTRDAWPGRDGNRRTDLRVRPTIRVGAAGDRFQSAPPHLYPPPQDIDPGSRGGSAFGPSSWLQRSGLCEIPHADFGERPFHALR